MGIENGMMKIEYQARIIEGTTGPDENGNWGQEKIETRIFSYPVGGDRRDTAFYGFGPREGTIGFHPDLPKIGQGVVYDRPSPDNAGHLMVRVYPAEAA